MSASKGKGKCHRWLVDRAGLDDGACLIWPFYTNPNGYGQLGHLGVQLWAHRVMCDLANGPAPTPKHEASHSCGNGHRGCVHPKHLAWKTKVQNRGDCVAHGTNTRSNAGNRGRLSPSDIADILASKGKERQVDLAARFGISWQSVSMIQRGKMYAGTKLKHWTDEEDTKIREAVGLGYSFPKMAVHVGRSVSAVMGRTYRLGLTSGQAPTRDRSAYRTKL